MDIYTYIYGHVYLSIHLTFLLLSLSMWQMLCSSLYKHFFFHFISKPVVDDKTDTQKIQWPHLNHTFQGEANLKFKHGLPVPRKHHQEEKLDNRGRSEGGVGQLVPFWEHWNQVGILKERLCQEGGRSYSHKQASSAAKGVDVWMSFWRTAHT